MTWALSWKSALYHTLIWTEYLIFYLIVRRVLDTENAYRNLITLMTIIFWVIGLPAIIEYCSLMIFGGSTSLGIRYAKYGEQINTIFPLVTVGVWRLNGKRFALGLSAVTTMWLFMLCTFGRTNIILFTGGMILLTGITFTFKRFHKYRLKSGLTVAGLIIAPMLLHSLVFFTETANAPVAGRFTDNTVIIASGNFRKFTAAISVEMFQANPNFGVGAGNFGLIFNEYRAKYAAENPNDVNLGVAENELPERSHNEYLQILAELGIVGGLIFFWFLCGFGVMAINALKNYRRQSLFPIAALLGLTLFLASSVVSSYSFRLMQNGFVFFFVLAFAAKLLAAKTKRQNVDEIIISPRVLNFGYAFGTAACLILIFNCLTRVASVYYSAQALNQPNLEQAEPFFETAFWLDDENPAAHFSYAANLLQAKRYAESARQYKQSVNLHLAGISDYSCLATAQILTGDLLAAEQTLAKAVEIFPRSIFARIRYADLLHRNGKDDLSQLQRSIARQIDEKQAQGWWNIITEGAKEAARKSFQEKQSTPPMDLIPQSALSAVMEERAILNPTEKIKFDFTQ